MIALVDYGAGNLTSVKKALAAVGADVRVPQQPGDLADAQGIIVPGVGHFGATERLKGAWTDAILARVGEGRPLLGICLGMQWLYESSDEAPDVPGLGLLAGRCYRLPANGVKIPHVGWNDLHIVHAAPILDEVASESQVYFTHSYVAPATNDTAATTEHGSTFAAVVQRGHVAGVQFHPEKSGDVGLRILRNFLAMVG
ncbi:MAG TPA: imidazole glycerol phosphate synthase subunit HisH [Vicinamibacterales bacterium]|nr:imidazole glycerol phosphate synthase subunit HisH [Vicinamibacterales bacterium]